MIRTESVQIIHLFPILLLDSDSLQTATNVQGSETNSQHIMKQTIFPFNVTVPTMESQIRTHFNRKKGTRVVRYSSKGINPLHFRGA